MSDPLFGGELPLRIGLTGRVASGKSLVRKILGEAGCHVVDADLLGHSSYEPGTECFKEVVAAFGEEVVGPDGHINRKVLGPIVFADRARLQQLNHIVWPHIRAKVEAEIARIEREAKSTGAAKPPVIVVEAAVMMEARWTDLFDEVWAVRVPREVAIERVIARDGLSHERAAQRIDTQETTARESGVEDGFPFRVITNDGTQEQLRERVTAALETAQRERASDKDELVWLVDKHNTELGAIRRSRMRREHLWHRATYIFAHDSRGRLFVQKRTMLKDYAPGRYDPVSGGVVAFGESYETGAVREVEEEIGVRGVPLTHLFTFPFESTDPEAPCRVWGDAWECTFDGTPSLQASEVASVHMWTAEECMARAAKAPASFTPDGLHALGLYQEHMARVAAEGPARSSSAASAVTAAAGKGAGRPWLRSAVLVGVGLAVLGVAIVAARRSRST